MYKSRGFRLPLNFFFEVHLFDLKWKTDTATSETEIEVLSENAKHGVVYMPSWTSVIRKAHKYLIRQLGLEFEHFIFIDVGCGKGKALLEWNRLNTKRNFGQSTIGIEYERGLADISICNLKKMNQYSDILIKDITELSFDSSNAKYIFYLYNPFDEILLTVFLDKIYKIECYIIYVNPVHAKLLEESSNLLTKKKFWHDSKSMNIYHKPQSSSQT
jgi:SAM-dependent methyltransferase